MALAGPETTSPLRPGETDKLVEQPLRLIFRHGPF